MIALGSPTTTRPGRLRTKLQTTLRAAREQDARRIAELFRLSADGVADYVWTQMAGEHPGLSTIEIGTRRYARRNAAFSFETCTVATRAGRVVGNCHAFVIEHASSSEGVDPVLRPYAELEAPGSLYISSLAVDPEAQCLGIGSALLRHAAERAKRLGVDRLSLIVFEQNQGALRLYTRFGFEAIDRRRIVPHPLIRAEGDALLMVRSV